MYKCPNCGGEIQFLPESGKIKCEYCGTVFSPEDTAGFDRGRKSAEEQDLPEGKVYTCSQCGASLYTAEDTGVTFCSYCGSQAFLESRIKGDDNIFPDLILPFGISKDQCEKIYRSHIKNAWFLPREMRADNEIDKFRGIYMPCWVYEGSVEASGEYKGTKTERDGLYDIIKTYEVTAKGTGEYGGYVEDASASFPDSIMREISPFDMKKASEFNDKYMAGFYADIGNVPSDVYEKDIVESLEANAGRSLALEKDIRGSGVSSYQINEKTRMSAGITSAKKGFLPVWFLSNKNRNGLMNYAVINGITGRIHADLPVDMKKYLLVSLLIAIPAFILLQFFTFKPMTILVVTMLLLAVLMFFSTRMIRETYIREHGLDDDGLLYIKRVMRSSKEGSSWKADELETDAMRAVKHDVKKTSIAGKIAGRTLFGVFCFLIIPVLSSVLSEVIGINIIAWGFIAGILLFVIFVSSRSDKNSKQDKDDFILKKKRPKLPLIMIMRSLILPLVGILSGAAVLIAEPAEDLYYYLAVIVCCVMLCLTVLDFVRANNRLASRKPAQLGKRGGDEDE